ncbi:MAG: exosortase-associated EpsI family protein [Sedimentisphaerales bacterium]|nr:exosortase-associated EpsI family protein [Sedimentisphaerales bacterium]
MDEYVIQPLKRLFRERAFLVCLLFLAVSAAGVQVGAKRLGLHFVKLEVALQRPFDELDEAKLAPYRVARKLLIENEDIIAELGTEDYLQWYLEDPGVAKTDPAQMLMLFITYYTGDPGQVPHVPEVCYTGAGSRITDREDQKIQIRDNEGQSVTIPVRILSEARTIQGRERTSKILYFFGANGGYVSSRNGLRLRLNNWYDKYAYFSKVEVSFPNGEGMSTEAAVKAIEKLMRKLVPILVAEHWPIWPPVEEKKNSEFRI